MNFRTRLVLLSDMTVLYSTLLDTYTQIYEQLIIFLLIVLGSSFPQWIWNSGLYLLILKFKTTLVEPGLI